MLAKYIYSIPSPLFPFTPHFDHIAGELNIPHLPPFFCLTQTHSTWSSELIPEGWSVQSFGIKLSIFGLSGCAGICKLVFVNLYINSSETPSTPSLPSFPDNLIGSDHTALVGAVLKNLPVLTHIG